MKKTKISEIEWKLSDDERTKCLVYTRVMGYHRPVESFNTGKKGEHMQRKHFTSCDGKTDL
jgi:hypothetical protein